MALDHDEFLRLSKIADSLRRSDPELARKLAGPVRPRSYRSVLCYLALSVFALVALTTAAMGDATTPSTVAKNASHTGERTAVRNGVDWKPTVRHAPPMRSPVDFGAEAP
jgi:Protein of unknown function (DUF3040)